MECSFPPPTGTEPTPQYRNKGKHSLIFNLSSSHRQWATRALPGPVVGHGGGRCREGRDSRLGVGTPNERPGVKRASQAIHSNGSQTGSQRPGAPTPTSGASELGRGSQCWGRGDAALTSPHGQGVQALFLTLPTTSRCGEGEPLPLLQRGAQRGQATCPKFDSTARTRILDEWTSSPTGLHY